MQPASFACPVCGLTFDEQTWSRACEAWCRTHKSCNLTITAHSRERQIAEKREVSGQLSNRISTAPFLPGTTCAAGSDHQGTEQAESEAEG